MSQIKPVFPEEWDVTVGESVNYAGPFVFRKNGGRNKLFIGSNCHLGKIEFDILGKNNQIIIGDNVHIKKAHFRHKGNNQHIRIGNNCRLNGVYFLCESGCNIDVGDDCLFSYQISIRTTDAHKIIDMESDQVINSPRTISIGNHVWIGTDVIVTKGVTIADDVVIGQRALVNKDILQSHTVAAGVPAKIIRTGTTWKR